MRKADPTLGDSRRRQIVEAAIAVITEQGIQNLSLSEIETKAHMRRGQLTYYFPTKEDILLAVFDHVLQRMCESVGKPAEEGGVPDLPESGWDMLGLLLRMILTEPPRSPEFGCLQYTFLAQISHREDFRLKLAEFYERWRGDLAGRLQDDLSRGRTTRSFSVRAMASFVQALIHGLVMQSLADPEAFDRQEMLNLSLDILGSYFGTPRQPAVPSRRAGPKPGARRPANGHAREKVKRARHIAES